MKKIIAVLLSVVLLFSCTAVVASAALVYGEQVPVDEGIDGFVFQYRVTGECTCEEGHNTIGKCHCCIFCPNLDVSYLTDCATAQNTDGATGFDGTLCCLNCTGIWPCDCGCACCNEKDQDLSDNENNIGDFWGPEQQESFVDAFQSILKQISDAFDRFFNAIFEFLRLYEILGIERN